MGATVRGGTDNSADYRGRMADEDVANEIRRQAQEQIDQLEQRGIVVPTDVDEDEAMHSVQQQLADAGFDCDAEEARRIVREARGQQ